VAEQLWESVSRHQEALVRAWIWYYLHVDDNLFSFSGGNESLDSLVKCRSSWTQVRALRRNLDGKY
jgi:hypothetical protein